LPHTMVPKQHIQRLRRSALSFAINVGDSRAVLSRNGSAITLTLDHKPDDASEKARVEATGGKVVWCGGVDSLEKPLPNGGIYRVNGNLALSRAIGDRSERPAVTSMPDVSTCLCTESTREMSS
jgi:serine/threonine protein phosphatase PrpC